MPLPPSKTPALVPTIALEGWLTLKHASPLEQADQSFQPYSRSIPALPTAIISASSCGVASRPAHKPGRVWGRVQGVGDGDGCGELLGVGDEVGSGGGVVETSK